MPTLLPRWTGIPKTVDDILRLAIEYLTYRCDHIIGEDIIKEPKNIYVYLNRNIQRQEEANGHIFEIIIRRWLKEFRESNWLNMQRLQILALPGWKLHV
ncbi:MAG: hypothetical protein QW272_05285 [Candidatus Methanomethylicaceae archaeon]